MPEKIPLLEPWEMQLAQKIAQRFVRKADPDDLISELQIHILKIKKKEIQGIVDWKSYLARALLRRASELCETWTKRRDETMSLESVLSEGEGGGNLKLEDVLSIEEFNDPLSGIDPIRVYEELSPYEKQLWDLLIEEEGDITGVAGRLRIPRTTVDYQVRKFRKHLKDMGLGE